MATAVEIRTDIVGAVDEVHGTKGGYPAQAAMAIVHILRYTGEVAAQLAEINDNLKTLISQQRNSVDPPARTPGGYRG